MVYIGRTSRTFRKRFSEHLRGFKNKDVDGSNVSFHLIKNKYKFTDLESNMHNL